MDEPLSNLDAQLRTSTRSELKSLQRRLGITTVYVTHDQTEAMSLGDRVAILRKGRIEQVGMPAYLYDEPANTFVASFIASPPMNLFEITMERDGGECVVRIEDRMLKVTNCMASPLSAVEAGNWILGVRPEHVLIGRGASGGPVIEGEIRVVESMGREFLLHLAIGTRELLALTTERRFAESRLGDSLDIELNLERAHLFTRSGERVRDVGKPSHRRASA
jgi:multiple sugar transport system ATP-binding protein